MEKGSLFLVPTYLSENQDSSFLAPMILDVIKNTTFFLVENVRTARRFISSLNLGVDISQLHFEIMDKNSTSLDISEKLKVLSQGRDVAVLSEAGLPGLADPGHLAVSYAHGSGFRVIPLPGASAIQTALITSGFNGQQFTFHGYLPIDKTERTRALKNMESILQKTGYTQIFMETPFRNTALINDLKSHLTPGTLLSICADVFGNKEFIQTRTIAQWKKSTPDLHKIPAVFAIGQFL